jgi:solute carrier family 35 protein E1
MIMRITSVALCLIASVLPATNAFSVQPRSALLTTFKPAQSLSQLTVSKRPSHFQTTALRSVDVGADDIDVDIVGAADIETDDAALTVGKDCDPYDPESSEFCTTDEPINGSLKRTIKLTTLFTLWYVLNVGYNIGNKRVLNALPIPWSVATVELFFGFPYVAMLWFTGLRKAPKLSVDNIKTLSSSAFFLAATHVLGVISFGAGAISFTHIVKATEPVWSALLLGVCFKEMLPLPVYLSLVPIIGGVGLASLKELSFSWLSFTTGTLSAVTSATKAILAKKVLDGKPLGENLTPANMFAVLTILGFLFILPASLLIEGPAKVAAAYTGALAAGYTKMQLFRLLGISGFLYYIYNEVAFLALSEVAPVTHAVANTVKRVVIILASVIVFRNPVSKLGALGSAMAILGATAYSVAKSKCKPVTKVVKAE